MRKLIPCLALVLPLVLWAVLPVVSNGSSHAPRLEQRIDATADRIARQRERERRLEFTVQGFQRRIDRVGRRSAELQRRQDKLERDLGVRRAAVTRTRSDLRAQRRRVQRLRARWAKARGLLAKRLVTEYKADVPDLMTVVLNSNGFADLLERKDFFRRVQRQDQAIMRLVQRARDEARTQVRQLDRLERRRARAVAAAEIRRAEVSRVRIAVAAARRDLQESVGARRQSLVLVRVSRKRQERHLAALEREQQRVKATLARAQRRAAAPGATAAPLPSRSAGRLVTPVVGPLTSPFGPRWGRLHAGIDIGAPGGTPIRSAEAGRVVLAAANGGYGLYTCIQHTTSMATCYAHQSRLGTRAGASVKRGEVIGYVGNTGNSFGDHLHFEVRINGNPVNPAPLLSSRVRRG